MKKFKLLSQKETILCFLMIMIQFLSLGLGNSIIEKDQNSQAGIIHPELEQELPSHSSPYYFKVQETTPLLSDDNNEEESLQTPKSADYSDYEALSIYLDKNAIIPNEALNMKFYLTDNLVPAANEAIHVSIYSGYYRNWYYYYNNYYEVSTPVETFTVQTNSNGEASYTLSNTANLGIYTIFAYTDGGNDAYKEFTIGDVGIFCKGPRYFMDNNDYKAAVQIVNLTDYSSLSNIDFTYSLSYYNYSLEAWEDISTETTQTDVYGYAIISAEFLSQESYYYSIRLTIKTLDNSAQYSTFIYKSWDYYYYSLWGGEQESNLDQYQFVVTTDKTIYNPGDVVNLRALILQYSFMNETKTILKNFPVQITLSNPDEMDIFWDNIVSDQNGVLLYQIPFDEDCDLGLYGITFEIEDIQYRYDIKVQYYVKPVFRVEIDTNGRDFYPNKNFNIFGTSELFEGKIHVEYYFGQPVVDASVIMVLKDYTETIVTQVEGKTNSMGNLEFSVNLAEFEELDYSFKAEVEVIDQYNREAFTSKQFTRIEELYAYGYLTDWAPNPADELEYHFSAYQLILNDRSGDYYWNYDYNPLANLTVTIEVFGHFKFVNYLVDIGKGRLIDSYQATTNIYGSGKLIFNIPEAKIGLYNLFEVKISVSLEDQRETESSTYFRFQKYSLDLEPSTVAINPGDNLSLTMSFHDIITKEEETGQGYIYLYDSEYQLLGEKYVELTGEENIEVYLSDYAPTGEYRIYSYVYSPSTDFYGGYNYHSAYLTFTVGEDFAITLNSNGTIIDTERKEIQVTLGDILSISGNIPIPSNLPVYIEIYKRGLLFSEKLLLNGGNFDYNLPITSSLGPDFTIMVYSISTTGRLYEEAIVAHISYDTGFTLETDKEIYEPGDTITLTISPNDNHPTLVSLSFIDSSVLDVEPEDDSELAYFTQSSYYAYIGSGSSWGSGFSAESYWWIGYGSSTGGIYIPNRYFVDDTMEMVSDYAADDANSQKGGERAIEPPSFNDLLSNFETEIRKNISESANWIPSLIITESTDFTFKLPDNIGEWTIRAVGNHYDSEQEGNLLWGEIQTIQIKTYLPFFIEFDIAEPIYQDDILSVKGYVHNYLEEATHVYVAIDAPGFAVLNNEVQQILVPKDYVAEIEFSLYCENPYMNNITLLAATNISGQVYSDAKLMNIYVQPNGLELINFTKGFLNATLGSTQINFTVDPLSIYNKETIALYTDLMDISIDSWESLIGYPYGCVEQTMSKLLPTAKIYKYLQDNNMLSSTQQQEMTQMIFEGLNRIYGFQHSDGGWGWWFDDNSRVQMSAIVLSALYQIDAAGFSISESVFSKAIDFILGNQKSDGTWMFEYLSSNLFESTAYISKALLSAPTLTSTLSTAIQKANIALQNLWGTADNQSPFGAALYYLGFKNSSFENTAFCDTLINYILLERDTKDGTVYWSNPGRIGWYWRNLGNNVEITSYCVWALALDGYLDHFSIIQKSIEYLLNEKNEWGWSSTADTAAAITSLTNLKSFASTNEIIKFDGNISIYINDDLEPFKKIAVSNTSIDLNDVLLRIPYTNLKSNNIRIDLEGEGQISYVFSQKQIIRANPTINANKAIIVQPGEEFEVSMIVSDITSRIPMKDVTVALQGIPEEMKLKDIDYEKYFSLIESDSEVVFTLQAPQTTGDYEIDQMIIRATIIYNRTDQGCQSQQALRKTIGPINVEVSTNTLPLESQNSRNHHILKTNSPLLEPLSSESSLSLRKDIESNELLLPGDIVNISITIQNNGEIGQYYAFSDSFPAGASYIENSLVFLMNDEVINTTLEVTTSGLNMFISELEVGTLSITYQLQIARVKNSYFGECRLWGMYDSVSVSADTLVLENIPIKYYSNDTLYRDVYTPQIQSYQYSQEDDTDDMLFKINLHVSDENPIQKIQILYSQGQGWKTYTQIYDNSQDSCEIILNDLENMDSNLRFIIMILDVYGNVISTQMFSSDLISKLIPYAIVGGIIGVSIGLAFVASYLVKKKGWQNNNLTMESNSHDDDKKSMKPDQVEVSFIDEEEKIEVFDEDQSNSS
ncbi:hypothetical protein WKT22_00209 [Candidatus Lokiarchaeum ossiferum]